MYLVRVSKVEPTKVSLTSVSVCEERAESGQRTINWTLDTLRSRFIITYASRLLHRKCILAVAAAAAAAHRSMRLPGHLAMLTSALN